MATMVPTPPWRWSVLLLLAMCAHFEWVEAQLPTLPYMDQFVTREGMHFKLDNGKVFLFSGFNSYYLMVYAADPNIRWEVLEVLDMAVDLELTVIRTWAFADGPTWHSLQPNARHFEEYVAEGLDFVVAEAIKRGIRLILTQVNQWPDYGGLDAYCAWSSSCSSRNDFFSDPTLKDIYKNRLEWQLNRVNKFTGRRYKDEPGIFAWELINEARVTGDTSGDILQAWTEEMSSFIKSIDPKHMITTGAEGWYGKWSPEMLAQSQHAGNAFEGNDFKRNHDIDTIDFSTAHVWVDGWLSCDDNCKLNFFRNWANDHVRISRDINKPFVMGEFGKRPRDVRDPFYQAMYDVFEQGALQGGANGAMMWHLVNDKYGKGALGDQWNSNHVTCPQHGQTCNVIRNHARKMNDWSMSQDVGESTLSPSPPPPVHPPPPPPPPPQQTRISVLCVGDSLTLGHPIPGGYRRKLFMDLTNLDIVVDMLGRLDTNCGQGMDCDHEGHGGYRIDQIDGELDSIMQLPSNSEGTSFVLLMIGANDLGQNFNLDNAPARLMSLLENIINRLPEGGMVLVSTVTRWGGAANTANLIQPFNDALKANVQVLKSSGNPVELVDAFAEIGPEHLVDGVHLTQAGYDRLADTWRAVLVPYINSVSSSGGTPGGGEIVDPFAPGGEQSSPQQVMPPPPPPNLNGMNLEIMPMGDSITAGYPTPGGYRRKLFWDLEDMGLIVDFVGSLTDNCVSQLPDCDHEGHGGWRIDQILSSIGSFLPYNSAPNPQFVTLMLGTNDIGQNYDLSNARLRLFNLIQAIAERRPECHIIVAKVTPFSGEWNNVNQVEPFNQQIEDWVIPTALSNGYRVSMVDMYAAIDRNTHLADAVHMNQAGSDVMAEVFRDEILRIILGGGANVAPDVGPLDDPEIVSQLPSGSVVLFEDAIASGWEDRSWDGSFDFDYVDTETGEQMIMSSTWAWGAMSLGYHEGPPLTLNHIISFWIKTEIPEALASIRFEIWGNGREWHEHISNLIVQGSAGSTEWVRAACAVASTGNSGADRLIWKDYSGQGRAFLVDKVVAAVGNQFPPVYLDQPRGGDFTSPPTFSTSRLSIMPMGDSITLGYPVAGGYRRILYDMLMSEGQEVDFVGSLTDNCVSGLPDCDHEGHSGWRTLEMQNSINSLLPFGSSGPQPAIILFLLGTNDVNSNFELYNTNQRLRNLLEDIFTRRPDAHIVCGSIPPFADEWKDQNLVAEFNQGLESNVVPSLQSIGRNIYFVDIHSRMSSWHLADQVHPNEDGYRIIAEAFYDGIREVVEKFGNAPVPSVGASGGGSGPVLEGPVSIDGLSIGVMPIGDSITEGFPTPGGYRRKLFFDLMDLGVDVDMMGRQNDNCGNELPDCDHEGHGGWRIDQIASAVDLILPWNSGPYPDFITMMIGTNDMGQNYDRANAPQRLLGLIDELAARRPDCHIILSNIAPFFGVWNNENQIEPFNALIESWVLPNALAKGYKISLVDMYNSINRLTDLSDGVHMNQLGSDKMADVFSKELIRILEQNELAAVPEEPEIVNSLASGSFVMFDDSIANGWEDNSWDGQYSYAVDDGSGGSIIGSWIGAWGAFSMQWATGGNVIDPSSTISFWIMMTTSDTIESMRFELWGGGMEWYRSIRNLALDTVVENTWVRVAVRAAQAQNNNINRLIWKNYSDKMVSFALDKVAVVMNNQYTEDLITAPPVFSLPSSAPVISVTVAPPPAQAPFSSNPPATGPPVSSSGANSPPPMSSSPSSGSSSDFVFLADVLGSSSNVIARETFCYVTAASESHIGWFQEVPMDDSFMGGMDMASNEPQMEVLVEMRQPGNLLYEPVESLTSSGNQDLNRIEIPGTAGEYRWSVWLRRGSSLGFQMWLEKPSSYFECN